MFNSSKFPFLTEQELNLDWILSEFAEFKKSMIPQVNIDVLTETNNSGVLNTLNRYNNKIPLGTSVIHLGRYADSTQVFILFFRASDESGKGCVKFTTNTSITLTEITLQNGEFVTA